MGKKKTFKDNPALQFISSTPEEKDFSGADFEAPKRITQAPEGYKMNALFVEKKSRRLQLILQPSLYDKVKEAAAREDISVNEYVHRTLEKATERM